MNWFARVMQALSGELGKLGSGIDTVIYREYDRRIRTASQVTEYGAHHGHAHNGHDHSDDATNLDTQDTLTLAASGATLAEQPIGAPQDEPDGDVAIANVPRGTRLHTSDSAANSEQTPA